MGYSEIWVVDSVINHIDQQLITDINNQHIIIHEQTTESGGELPAGQGGDQGQRVHSQQGAVVQG